MNTAPTPTAPRLFCFTSLCSHREMLYLQSHTIVHRHVCTFTVGAEGEKNTSPIWPGTGNPLGSDFADEQTIAGTANVLLPCWGILNRLHRETRDTQEEKIKGHRNTVLE